MNNDAIILILIFITHLFLISWAVLAFMNSTYVFYNVFFLISLLWSIHENKSSAPTLSALMVNLMGIVMDAALIGIIWWNGTKHWTNDLSIAASFINMLYRLLTSLILYQMWKKRDESEGNRGDFSSASRDLTMYLNFRPRTANVTGQTTTHVHNTTSTTTVSA